MADASDSRRSPAVKDHNNEVTLYRDNQPLLKVECGISLGLLKLIYSSDASYDGILLGVKPRLLTESVPCVVTFDSTQLTYPEYDLIVQAAPAAVHLQKAVSRDEEISAGTKKSFISRARGIACYNRNYPEESSHSLAHSASAQIQHEEIAEKCITPGSSSSNNQTDASQDVQLSLRSICISAIQSAGSNVAQFTRGHHLPSHQVFSSSENFTYMDCDTNELPDSTVQEFEVEVLDVSTETDKTREIAEQDFEAPEGIQFNPEEFNFDIGSVIPFQSVKGTRWPCDRCGKDFCSSSHLKRHWILHTDFKPYKCKVCSKCFAFHWDLKKHSTKHTGNKPFKCSFCPKSFNSQVERKNHNWLHTGKKEYKCQLCHHEFISLSNLNAHMRKHTGEKPYKCEYCPKSFHILGHYQYHMRRHTGEKPYKCEICGKAFSYSNNLTEHRNVHTGERPYSCSQCNKRFTHRSTFKQHMLMHKGNKPYKCHVCSKAFVQSSNYQRHIETHKKKEDRVQKCDLCGKELLSRRGVQKHRLRCVKKTVERANAHLRVLRTSRLRRGEYRCELCPRIFSYSRRLETHVASKHPPSQEDSTMEPSVESTFDPFAAENAGSGNDVSSGKGSRSKRGEFRCEHCPKIFVYGRRLQSHVRKYHSSSTNDSTDNAKIHPPSPLRFQCSACGRWFDHTKRLREHQIKNHRRGLLQETASTAVPHAGVPLLPKSSDSDKNVLREETRHPLEAVPRVIQTDISPVNSQAATGERTKNYLHPDDKDKREAGETGFESLSALSRLFAQIGMEGNTSSQSIVESGQISQQ